MKKITEIKNISCYGSARGADYFIVCDEEYEHIIDNHDPRNDQPFNNFTDLVDYLLANHTFNGEIQEIGAE